MKKLTFILLLLMPVFLTAQEDVYLADPTIMFFEGKYYMYGTEMKPQVGIPVLQSDDLKTWEVPEKSKAYNGHSLEKDQNAYGTWGFWAPQVFFRNGKYYMLYTANENIAIAESNSPEGLFTQSVQEPLKADTRQIDPYLFFDEDGKIYLYHVRLNKGNSIWVAEFKEDLSGIKPETLKQCITATEEWEATKAYKSLPVIEGPTVIKRGNLYYMFYSANHFESVDYAVGYAVSESPAGPWIKAENNPIIHQSIIGKNGTGHGDLFMDKDGTWKYVFHTHNSETVVQPRRTGIVDVKFKYNKKLKRDVISVDKKSVFFPKMKH